MADAEPQVAEGNQADSNNGELTQRGGKRRLIMFSVPILLVIGGLLYWWSLQGKVSTENAYVKLDKVSIAPEVTGPLVEVFVRENDEVKRGQLLFRIDAEPFQVKKAEANAELATAQADVTALANDPSFSGADVADARADITLAKATLSRQRALWEHGFTTRADFDAAQHAVSQAEAKLSLAVAEQQEARAKLASGAAVPGENPRIAMARTQLENADLNLRRTEVRAPMSGRVGEADRLQPGQLMISGLPVLTIVVSDSAYVEANFKETQLTQMKVGQPAQLRFDAYPDVELRGHVASIGSGTGSEFSVLPAQNATGNWVKVTQRVPVRIKIDGKAPFRLIAGLSTHVTVFTDGRKN